MKAIRAVYSGAVDPVVNTIDPRKLSSDRQDSYSIYEKTMIEQLMILKEQLDKK